MLAQFQFESSSNDATVILIVILVVVGVINGAFTAWVAEEKGRSSAWFILGFLFSVLALLAVGLAPSKSQSERPGAKKSGAE
jgi:hypothetical protein